MKSISAVQIHFHPPPKKFWYCASNLVSDYANSCSNSVSWGVPNNIISGGDNYQYARTGNGYLTEWVLNFPPYNNSRTYYQTKLKDSLQKNKNYYCEFYLVFANNGKLKSNNISALLTKTAIYVDTINFPGGVLHANAQIYNYGNPIINDTLNWVKVSGIYEAQGGEQYLTLGNFKDDTATQYYASQPTGYNGAAIMIDDVSVIPLDSFCLKADAGRDTTIKVGDSMFIGSLTNGLDSIKWYANGTTLIDSTRPGFWVKPTTTGSYIYVLQQTVNGCFSSDTVYVNVVLPLKFLKYEVRSTSQTRNGINEQQVTSNWFTDNEINVSHFYVQRSSNGRDFVTIHKEQAKNQALNNYSFIDDFSDLLPSPVGEGLGVRLYYKIVSVDKDGKTSFSEVRIIEVRGTNYEVRLFPNPAKDIVNIECKEGIKEVKIIDMFGKEISHFVRNDGNVHHLSFNIHHYPKGVYVVQVITKNNEVYNQKLMVE